MSIPIRILVTGSRAWLDENAIRLALEFHLQQFPMDRTAVLVHGAAAGADSIAARIWSDWHKRWPWLFAEAESHPAFSFPDPKVRNQHMVDLGAEVCLVFAREWASGSGHCARAARRAGIRTVDYGVPTGVEHRPEVAA